MIYVTCQINYLKYNYLIHLPTQKVTFSRKTTANRPHCSATSENTNEIDERNVKFTKHLHQCAAITHNTTKLNKTLQPPQQTTDIVGYLSVVLELLREKRIFWFTVIFLWLDMFFVVLLERLGSAT